jgi:hypothetical protein
MKGVGSPASGRGVGAAGSFFVCLAVSSLLSALLRPRSPLPTSGHGSACMEASLRGATILTSCESTMRPVQALASHCPTRHSRRCCHLTCAPTSFTSSPTSASSSARMPLQPRTCLRLQSSPCRRRRRCSMAAASLMMRRVTQRSMRTRTRCLHTHLQVHRTRPLRARSPCPS